LERTLVLAVDEEAVDDVSLISSAGGGS